MLTQGKDIPNEQVTLAEGKVAGFTSLKRQIDAEMLYVHDGLGRVAQLIEDNAKSEQRPICLLTRDK